MAVGHRGILQRENFVVKLALRFFRYAALLLVGVFMSLPTLADTSSEPFWAVTVEDAEASAAGIGETARIRMKIDNFSGRTVTLSGVSSDRASAGALVLYFPGEGARDVAQLSILHDEVLDLSTSHIRAELRGLVSPLAPGEIMEFEIILDGVEIPVTVHIH